MLLRSLTCLALTTALLGSACSDSSEPASSGERASGSAAGAGGSETPLPTPENTPVPQAKGPQTVVLISLDTLRPDRLGIYGNTAGSLEVSPRIDAFSREAVVFDQALAASPWTLPSHMTMLTGLDPIAHGVKNGAYKLSSGVPTLAEGLKEAGFSTGAFTDGGFVIRRYGFDAGFDLFDDVRNAKGEGPNGFERLLPKALDWLEDRKANEDAFLFLHTFDVHAPFDEGDEDVIERFRKRPTPDGPDDWGLSIVSHMHQQTRMGLDEYTRLSQLANDYDAGVYEVDRGVGKVIDTLKDMGRYDDALIIITSDHGESFFEHGLHVGHGIGLKDDELRVPLIVKYPGAVGGGSRHDELVGLVDIPRTVLEVARLDIPETTQGESLVGLSRGMRRKVDFIVGASQNIRAFFLVQNGFKYITPVGVEPMLMAQRHLGPQSPSCIKPNPDSLTYTIGAEPETTTLVYDLEGDPLGLRDVLPSAEELYDRGTDPGEMENLATNSPPQLEKMRQIFENHYAASDAIGLEFFDPDDPDANESDPTDLRVLQALGYLDNPTKQSARSIPRHMREWVTNPWVAPDTELLQQADRRVQRVRARAREGNLTQADRDALQKAGSEYLKWYEQHQHFRTRIEWRVLVVLGLAEDAGFSLNIAAWSKSIPPGTWTIETLVPSTGTEQGTGQNIDPAPGSESGSTEGTDDSGK